MLVGTAPRSVAATDAAELVKGGIMLRRNGDDAGALEKFDQAYKLQESPRTLAQIGLAELALGRWAVAHDHLTAALDARGDVWIAKNRQGLVDALKAIEKHVGKLEVLGQPGAEVHINGVARGVLPLAAPITIATGTASIDLVAPGFVAARRITVISAGQLTRESLDSLMPITTQTPRSPLPEPRGAAQPADIGATTITETAGPRGDSRDKPNPAADTAEPTALRRSAKWVAGGAAVAALAAGTIAYVLHRNAAEEFGRSCRVDSNGEPVPLSSSTANPETCRSKTEQWNTEYRWSIVGLAAGAAFAAAGVVLWLTEPNVAQQPQSALNCSPSGTATTITVGCHLKF